LSKLRFFDSTLRDGSHAIQHQLTKRNIEDYCQSMDSAGMYTIIVGHGNGLGASSLQVGLSLTSDQEMLQVARKNIDKTKLGAYMIPGFGTINDNIRPAIESGVDLFVIGCHCTEADTTRQYIEYILKEKKEVYGVLMMYHMASTEMILEEAEKIQSYGAKGVIIMDSAGASTPEMVKKTISTLYDGLDIEIGFHSHNNMGMAVANAYTAYKEGASIIDGTLRGFGAGAGNCQLEALVALLEKNGIRTNADLYRMLDTSEQLMPKIMKRDMGIEPLSIISGMSGIFSSFKIHAEKAAKEFNVDARDIIKELGKRKAVGGQEDMIIEIAEQLSNPIKFDNTDYQLSSLL
jgi:4-hydroxy 2-oxovalerate aldolase